MLTLETPTKLRISLTPEQSLKELRMHLSYIDKSNDYQIHQLKNSPWRNEKTDETIKQMEAARKQCLLFEDEKGLWTYSGMALSLVVAGFGPTSNEVVYPPPTP